MPVATAGLAKLGAGDAQPLVLGGGDKHALEQLAVGGLHLGALGEGFARLGDATGEAVANSLQLTEVDQARRRRGGVDAGIDGEARKSLCHQLRELALEPADLAPQFGAGQALVALDASR